MLKLSKLMTADEIEEEVAKSFKMNGLLVEDPEVIEAMDSGIDGYSNVIPVRLNKSGEISTSQSKTVVKEDMQAIRRFVRGKHQAAGNGILEGDTQITPYKVKEQTPCQFCSYRSVCQFDPADPDQHYRKLPVLNTDKAIELIRKEAAGDDTEQTD
ncbi:hypothetical protein [Planococcus koreensis]